MSAQRKTIRDSLETARSAFREACEAAAGIDLSWIQPPPRESDWRLAPGALRLTMALAQTLRARHVIEFGAGLSTRALGRALAAGSGRAAISSIDHDPEYGALARRAYEAAPAPRVTVRFQIAPVVMRECGGELLPVYAINPARIAARRAADLILIDGPPEPLGGRQGTLCQAMAFARPGTIVLLDDAGRSHERRVLAAWEQDFGDAIEVLQRSDSPKGMAALLVRQPVPAARLWGHRATLTARDLLSAIPAEAPVVLVDDGQWGPELLPGRRVQTFIERDGAYWGPPESDQEAVLELQALAGAGARFLALLWPSFWWLDHYPSFAARLAQDCRCVLKSTRFMLFDLQGKP